MTLISCMPCTEYLLLYRYQYYIPLHSTSLWGLLLLIFIFHLPMGLTIIDVSVPLYSTSLWGLLLSMSVYIYIPPPYGIYYYRYLHSTSLWDLLLLIFIFHLAPYGIYYYRCQYTFTFHLPRIRLPLSITSACYYSWSNKFEHYRTIAAMHTAQGDI